MKMKIHRLAFLALSVVFMLAACSSDTDSSSSSSTATINVINESGLTITHFSYSSTQNTSTANCSGTNLLTGDLANNNTATVTTSQCDATGYSCVEAGGAFVVSGSARRLTCGSTLDLTYN